MRDQGGGGRIVAEVLAIIEAESSPPSSPTEPRPARGAHIRGAGAHPSCKGYSAAGVRPRARASRPAVHLDRRRGRPRHPGGAHRRDGSLVRSSRAILDVDGDGTDVTFDGPTTSASGDARLAMMADRCARRGRGRAISAAVEDAGSGGYGIVKQASGTGRHGEATRTAVPNTPVPRRRAPARLCCHRAMFTLAAALPRESTAGHVHERRQGRPIRANNA